MISKALEEYLKTMYILKQQNGNIRVTDIANKMNCTKPSVNKALNNLKVEGKTLILLPEKNETVQKSARNIEGVKTTLVNTINVYDLLKYKNLVITLDTVKKLEEVYA